jgi:SAM-dependent methyltransferase
MLPKPKHLGAEYAAQFQDRSVVDAYRYRPPYPAAVFAILADLMTDEPRVVLDAGCGTGEVARHLADRVERVDAVDFSLEMIATGRRLSGGDHPRLTWIHAPMETAPLRPPYALITAGSSLHWMAWDVVLPRFRAALTPRGALAIIGQEEVFTPWVADLRQLIPRFSTNQDFQPYDLIAELETRGLFRKRGERRTAAVPFTRPIDAYIESFHARNGFSRQRMRPDMAARFDAELRALVAPFCPEGLVTLQVIGVVVWGNVSR